MCRRIVELTNLLIALLTSFTLLTACSDGGGHDKAPSPPRYALSVVVMYATGPTKIQLNNAETIAPESEGWYFFNTKLAEGENIKIEILDQPINNSCTVPGGPDFTMPARDSEIVVECDVFHRGLANATEIAAGIEYTCAIADGGVWCWGPSAFLQSTPPPLINPRQLSSGPWDACVIDDDGIHCWGTRQAYAIPTDITNPQKIAVGYREACAIDGSRHLHCWSLSDSETTDFSFIDNFNNVTDIGLGDDILCARQSEELSCWKISTRSQLTTPDNITAESELFFGGSKFCAISDSDLTCWQYDYASAPSDTFISPPQIEPSYAAFGAWGSDLCVIDQGIVKCSLFSYDYIQRSPDVIINPTRLAVGFSHACAIDDLGVICWGASFDFAAPYTEVPQPIY